MPRSSSSDEGFCWRSWPCDQCSQGVTPIGYLFRCSEAGSGLLEGTPEEVGAKQAALLVEWCGACSHEKEKICEAPWLAQGSEHAVFLNEKDAHVFKLTLPGTFGEYYYLVDGKVHQEKCTPLQYLIRLHLWAKIFGSGPYGCGITASGQVISLQEFITGTTPTQEEVDDFLVYSGCLEVKRTCWLWKRPYEEFEVWIGDARRDNFVMTPSGIVPIDLRVWLASPEPART